MYKIRFKNDIVCLTSRTGLNQSQTVDYVDLVYNGLSDKYETLYPYQVDPNNGGTINLLTKEELGSKQARYPPINLLTKEELGSKQARYPTINLLTKEELGSKQAGFPT